MSIYMNACVINARTHATTSFERQMDTLWGIIATMAVHACSLQVDIRYGLETQCTSTGINSIAFWEQSPPGITLLSNPNRVAENAVLGIIVGDLSGHVCAAGLAHALVGLMIRVNRDDTHRSLGASAIVC